MNPARLRRAGALLAVVLCTGGVAGCAAGSSLGGSGGGAQARDALEARRDAPAGGSAATARAIVTLQSEARPVGRGPHFHPPVRGVPVGRCTRTLGRRVAVHVEVFAADRVVLLPAGIGVRGPRRRVTGRIQSARCYSAIVTLDPTGVVLARPGTPLRLGGLFRAWGEPLSRIRLAGFAATPPGDVRAFVDGRRRHGDPRAIALRAHDEIVLEVGPRVPPHRGFAFAPAD